MAIGKHQRSMRACWMRGGTSKGLFLKRRDLPLEVAHEPRLLDRFLLRLMGSPDPYRKQIDGLGGATPSTSKVVIVSPSDRPDCEISYRFGAVSISEGSIDWSANCGNLTSAVAPFALFSGLLSPCADGPRSVRMWQENVGQIITARFSVEDGLPAETGTFILDGVPFPAAEITLEFLEDDGGIAFPTGQVIDILTVPGHGEFEVTLVRSGSPTVFIDAQPLGLTGCELHEEFARRSDLPSLVETIRCEAGARMGLAPNAHDIGTTFPNTPRVAIVSPPQAYATSAGNRVPASDIDLLVRIMSLGKLHHAMTGTGAVALAVASAVPGTVVSRVTGGPQNAVRFGHPSGTTQVGADVFIDESGWKARSIVMSRSARRLMAGEVFFPASVLEHETGKECV
ncbi:PrpF domain-containing protein [Paraburkholderia sp. BL17N1]|uniref:PrpF domain-containing protein n=1 Tax=Paraburkholderia sp. BL17N1 TaxID=1938798 RepID=UPI000EB557E3|nr:PrpF domain-containing protein [Paraburkholderia sp. BL17N1]RKR31366.1 hypothetical protein B0G82_7513 [Paraburkholderia sp. BL17N1]